MELIDLARAIKEKKRGNDVEWFKEGKAILSKLDKTDADAVLYFIRNYHLFEIKISKGLIDVDDATISNDDLFRFADEVEKIYSQAAAGCYLCDPAIDPNATGFTLATPICIRCQKKLENIFDALGIQKKRNLRKV